MSNGMFMTATGRLGDIRWTDSNPLFSKDDSETQAIILTPYRDDGNGIEYPTQVNMMQERIRQLLPKVDDVEVKGYHNVHGRDPEVGSPGNIQGAGFRWGKVLIQYDPENRTVIKEDPDTAVKCRSIEAAVEVIIGDGILHPILAKSWDATDEQLGVANPGGQQSLTKRERMPICFKEVTSSTSLSVVSSLPATSFGAGPSLSGLLQTTFKTSISPSRRPSSSAGITSSSRFDTRPSATSLQHYA